MPHRTRVAALLLPLSLCACATLSESQCGTGDWFGVGETDARSGHTPDRLVLHEEACARYAIQPDPHAYALGYAQGLTWFCVPEPAFALGRRGGSYYRQCPPEAEAAFLPAFEDGREVHVLEQELLRIDTVLEDVRDEIKDEKAHPDAREAARHALVTWKDERDRLRQVRDGLLARARDAGYGNVW